MNVSPAVQGCAAGLVFCFFSKENFVFASERRLTGSDFGHRRAFRSIAIISAAGL
ncbi:hypothetical protein JCM6292_2996 [Bacteroides pyogenes JCM 6292]|uniref:Uncharacterized protein n=1 Tax=Bacteroides pyogenes JCM 6292 TaxID=1235809 RepID=W4PBL9_9BACE|nr:hypothetical protein JCM6292_2996 [Bacteroides pyogenes JCM 6292]